MKFLFFDKSLNSFSEAIPNSETILSVLLVVIVCSIFFLPLLRIIQEYFQRHQLYKIYLDASTGIQQVYGDVDPNIESEDRPSSMSVCEISLVDVSWKDCELQRQEWIEWSAADIDEAE